MRDIFLDGLRILDLLEITGSTATTARWVNCDQSSVSRSYRRVSDQLGLSFGKTAGRYQARSHLPLLCCLRQAAQMLRLDRGAPMLQWVSHIELTLTRPLLSHYSPIPRCWSEPSRTLDLLSQRVLDLAVMPDPVQPHAAAVDELCIVPLAPQHHARVVILRELQDQPGLQQLIKQLETTAAASRIVAAAKP